MSNSMNYESALAYKRTLANKIKAKYSKLNMMASMLGINLRLQTVILNHTLRPWDNKPEDIESAINKIVEALELNKEDFDNYINYEGEALPTMGRLMIEAEEYATDFERWIDENNRNYVAVADELGIHPSYIYDMMKGKCRRRLSVNYAKVILVSDLTGIDRTVIADQSTANNPDAEYFVYNKVEALKNDRIAEFNVTRTITSVEPEEPNINTVPAPDVKKDSRKEVLHRLYGVVDYDTFSSLCFGDEDINPEVIKKQMYDLHVDYELYKTVCDLLEGGI